MSSIHPKTEARRRPVSVLALKLWEMAEALDERLDNPAEILEVLVSSAAKGEQVTETWEKLHEAATRFDKTFELAAAYEHVTIDKRLKLFTPEQQAFIFLQAAQFFATLGDTDAAAGYAQRAVSAVPGDRDAFGRLTALLNASGRLERLAQHYLDGSQRETEPERRRELLEHAYAIGGDMNAASIVTEAGQRLLKLSPERADLREEVMRRLLAAGRHKEVVDLLEALLAREPAPAAEEAQLLREQLVDLCSSVLKSAERALPHVEGLLRSQPTHAIALQSAEGLLEHKTLMLRAAAALSDAFERSGNTERAIAMLTFELQKVRGPRRIDVQRRLGMLRYDVLGDAAGALELLAPVVAGDPGDDELRRRFVELSLKLNQPGEAARLLSRALQSHKDPAVRARVGVDVGDVCLKAGDVKRAQAAFQNVLEASADDQASLMAAHRLTDLFADTRDLKQLSAVLATVVRLEPEREARQAAARRLARLADGEVPDPERAILALRALVGSPWTDEALTRLEELYQAAGDDAGQADVLTFRAERVKDPEQARRLGARALELRTARTRDPELALAAYQEFLRSFGASREVHARLLPLLEQTGRFAELASLLEQEIELSEPPERAALWLRLALLRQSRLNDAAGALRALQQTLREDPRDAKARGLTEKLLLVPELRGEVVSLLEPLYRQDPPSLGLLRVLEARVTIEPNVAARLQLLEEAALLAQETLRDTDRALEISARALSDAVVHAKEQVPTWLARVLELGAHNPGRRARFLLATLGTRAVDSAELFQLAEAAGDAAQAAGDLPSAIEIYRRALAFESSSHRLVQAIDDLLVQQGAPTERLALYESALAKEQEPRRRRDLMHALARLQRVDLGDSAAALVTLRQAVTEAPADLGAHDALVEALTEASDHAAVVAELARMLPALEGARQKAASLRLAEAAERAGDPAFALDRYRQLLKTTDLSDSVLAQVERLARELRDGATLGYVLEQRLASTAEPRDRVAVLERLAETFAQLVNDPERAADSYLAAARLSESGAPERSRALYEAVLQAAPLKLEAAERLVELCALERDWPRLTLAFDVLQRHADERQLAATLARLEPVAVEHGTALEFADLVDRVLSRGVEAARGRALGLAKARALGSLPGRGDEVAALFRGLIEAAGPDNAAEEEAFAAFLTQVPPSVARQNDLRWLFRFRAERAADPSPVLLEWARSEERDFGDKAAARKLYERVTLQDPDQSEAWTELARLQAEAADLVGALRSLEQLRKRVEPDARWQVDLRIANLLLDLGHPERALELTRPLITAFPSDKEVLRVVHRALPLPATRAEAASLLELAAERFEDPARRADVIEALLAVSADAPELAAARSRWLTQLLETKSDEPEEALRIALRGADAAPGEYELWRLAEQMARKLDNPQPVVEAYARIFERELAPELANELGQRRVEFFGEWFDEPQAVIEMMERVLALHPEAEWAFDRLKLSFNAAGRWGDLYALYDARLGRVPAAAERIELLREAAMAARDFASDPERAIFYLEALNRELPGDSRVDASLERLYERHEKRRPLIALLSQRLTQVGEEEQSELRRRVAALWLDLQETAPALELAQVLLANPASTAPAVELLERLIRVSPLDQPATYDTPLLRATGLLTKHYRSIGKVADVVRMLEIEERVASDREERRRLLEAVVRLRLDELADQAGAFETTAQLVLLDPGSSEYRLQFAELGGLTARSERRAAVLEQAAESQEDPDTRGGLFNESAHVCRDELSHAQRAMVLYRRTLALPGLASATELQAARELSDLLRQNQGDALERVTVLERFAELVQEPEQRRAALGEAAELSFDVLEDVPRAVAAYRRRLHDDPSDLPAMHGLCLALGAIGHWDQLIVALEQRARIQTDAAARNDRVQIAELYAQTLNDPRTAIEAWRRVAALHGGDRGSFAALSRLLEQEQRFKDLAELVRGEIAKEADAARLSQLFLELGALHEQRTHDPLAALEAYVSASDWDSAIRVAGARPPDRATGRRVCARLLDLATTRWLRGNEPVSSAPAQAANWALTEFCQRLLEDGEYLSVVRYQLQAAELPFELRRRRDLRREAACLVSDRLGDSAWAIQLFQQLLAEDPADDVAVACVTRLSLLLEEKERFEEIVTLWERQAEARASAGDVSAAQVLWARAGELSEERLHDTERALGAYGHGADLGGEVCLQALARIYQQQGRIDQVASSLAKLCEQSGADVLGERALALCEAYVALGRPGEARRTLERAQSRVVEGAPLRARLASLYRDASDYASLARLTEEEAERAPDVKTRLLLLREAAELHLDQRRDPVPATPLLERAVELDPDDSSLRLLLSRALYEQRRFAEAAAGLRDKLSRYGSRRPKDRALVHFELARALLAAQDRIGALAELDAAAKIDPAHPSILSMLARTALEQGELERAERMYRALLLVNGREDDPNRPSRSEALFALGEVAAQRGDAARAEEFVADAFEAAREQPREARVLEHVLRLRGRQDLLPRALDLRLNAALSAPESARVLADLTELGLGSDPAQRKRLLERARATEAELERVESLDDGAWSALGRVYASLEEVAGEGRVLERRVEASSRSNRPPPDADLLFRLARARFADGTAPEEAMDLLERALGLLRDLDRAEELLKSAFAGDPPPRAAYLLERIARERGDQGAIVAAIERRAAAGDADMAAIREGLELSSALGDPELAGRLLRSALAHPDKQQRPEDTAWLQRELAGVLRRAGDESKALDLEERASTLLAPAQAKDLSFEIVERALAKGDETRALRVLSALHVEYPEEPSVYEPLLTLYRRTNQHERLEALLASTSPIVVSAQARNALDLERVNVLLALGRHDDGIQLLKDVVRDFPDAREARQRLNDLLASAGREEELCELLDAELDELQHGDPERFAQLSLRLATLWSRLGRIPEALEVCARAIAREPGRRDLLELSLRLAKQSEDPDALAEAIERLLVVERGAAAAALARELLALREKVQDPAGAERALELGVQACPADLELCEELAQRYADRGDNTRVVELLERAIAEHPDDRGLLHQLLGALRSAGQTERGLTVSDHFLRYHPEDLGLRRVRAALLSELSRDAEAVAELQQVHALDASTLPELVAALTRALERAEANDDLRLLFELCDLLEQSGDATAARQQLSDFARNVRPEFSVLSRLARLEERAGNSKGAQLAFLELSERADGPELAEVALSLARLSLELGEPQQARAALERAFEQEPQHQGVRRALAEALEAEGAHARLSDLLLAEADALAGQERWTALLRAGELLLNADEPERAAAALEPLHSESPDNLDAVALLARAYTRSTRLDLALSLLTQVLEQNRGKRSRGISNLFEEKANVHLEEGFLTDALSSLNKAFELDPKNARLAARLGRLAFEADENDLAQKVFRSVAIMKTADVDGPDGARAETKADANYVLAMLALRAQDPRKARILVTKALSENPEHAGAKALVAEIDRR